ncbi:MAG: hypothetical protein CMQ54_02135 [Gammaproteobacteria bacterium]|nr:hypothetical protein [Gammaproteobacteria bacterium]
MEAKKDNSTKDTKSEKKISKLRWAAYLLLFAIAAFIFLFFGNWWENKQLDNENFVSNEYQQNLETNTIDYSVNEKKINSLKETFEKQFRSLKSIPTRMSSVEDRVSSLVGASSDTRNYFLISEAEYYLQIANFQLQIINNPKQASLALRIAYERIKQISSPDLIEIQQIVLNEIDLLEKIITIDLENIVLKILDLSKIIENLPLKRLNEITEIDKKTSTEERNIIRAWNATKDAMSNLVQVTSPGSPRVLSIYPESENLLKSNMQLQLQLAGLSLLQGKYTIFEDSFNNVEEKIDYFFDPNNQQIKNIKIMVSEIRAEVVTLPVPDISKSLNLLREFKNLNETVE